MKNNQLVKLNQVNENLRELKRLLLQLGENKVVEQIEDSYSLFRNREIVISVMGVTKRGKSTLVNALLEREDDFVAPVDSAPATSMISTYKYSSEETATVFFQNGENEIISYPEIRSFVTVDENPNNVKQVESLVVEGPFSGLDYLSKFTDSKILIYDTPGAESIEENYDNILYNYIPRSDVILYAFTLNQPITKTDIDFIKNIKTVKGNSHGLILVLNKKDLLTDAQLNEAISYTKDILRNEGISPLPEIIPISASQAIGNMHEPLFQKLINILLLELKESSLHESYLRMLTTRIVKAVYPAVLKLSISLNQKESEVKLLELKLNSLPEEISNLKQEFEEKWDAAIDNYLYNLSVAQSSIDEQISLKFKNTSFFAGSSHGNLQNAVNVIIKKQLSSCTKEIYTELSDALDILGENYISTIKRIDTACNPEQTNSPTSVYAQPVTKTMSGILLTSGAPALGPLLASAVTFAGSGGTIASIGGAIGSMIALPIGAILGFAVAPIGLIMAGSGIIKWKKVYTIKRQADLLNARDAVERAVADLFRKLEREAKKYKSEKNKILSDYKKGMRVKSTSLVNELEGYDRIDFTVKKEIYDSILKIIEDMVVFSGLNEKAILND